MAVSKGMTLEGSREIMDALKKVAPKQARNIMRSTIHGVAGEIAKEMKRGAPKDEGTLRKAIKTKRRRPKGDLYASDVLVTTGRDARHDAFYWRFIEYGTAGETGHPARPFARPVVERKRAELDEILERQFGKKLEAAMRRQAKRNAKK